MAFNVNALADYVRDNRDQLIGKIATNTCTLRHIGLQTGVKFKDNIHLMDVNANVQDGSNCSFDASGDAVFTDKTIEVAPMKVNMEFCDKDLRKKWAQYEITTAAKKGAMPFEEKIVAEIGKDVEKYLEKQVWQGDKGNGDLIDGFLTQMAADGTVNQASISGSTAFDKIKAMILALPQELVDNDAVIFIGKDLYRQYLADLVALNLYHYSEEEDKEGVFHFPAFSTEIIPVEGLSGTNKMVAGLAEHLIYGTDLEDDKEVYDVWYSQDDRKFKVAVEWVSGVAYPFGDEIVLGNIQ